jgi:hypothetical protein
MDAIGLDFGQMRDYAAASVLRGTVLRGPDGQPLRTSSGRVIRRFDMLALKRYPLGTSYTSIVGHLADQVRRPELWPDRVPPRVVVDATGVGKGVLEMLRTALKSSPTVEVWGIVLTSGKAVTRPGPHEIHLAKIELAGAIRQVLEDGRLRVPPQLEFAEALRKELQDFTVRVTAAANETFSAVEGGWDDLVIAAALPIWLSGWLDLNQVPIIAGPGPRLFPDGRTSGTHASTFGGLFRPSRPPPLEGAGRRPHVSWARLFGRGPSGR